jgi:two-component system response regulator FixJ
MDQKKTLAKRRVHIVDDDPKVSEAVALMLSTARIESQRHGSAEEYLKAVSHGDSACVLLDNRLPGLSGIDLLRHFAETGSDVPVIMMTGHGDVPTAVTAMKLGAFHFVEKPFDARALLSSVEEALSLAENIRDLQSESKQFEACRAQLTPREAEVYELLLEGMPTKSIAARLDITARTAEHHRAAVLRKFDARSISHLMRMALSPKKSLPPSALRGR